MAGLFVPTDGRLTSANVLAGPLTGGEVMYIVSPGNVAQGNSYQVSTLTLSTFFNSFPLLNSTVVTVGPTYSSVATDTRILVDLANPGALAITILNSSSYSQPILIKDIAGNVSAGNPTSITFSSGQLADGETTITLQNAYAGIWLNPLPNGFYITNA